MVTIRLDLTGRTFGQLHVHSQAHDYLSPAGRAYAQWRCICTCGRITVVRRADLISGRTITCGRQHPVTNLSYRAAHMRVTRSRGPAKAQQCIDCGGPAAEWSYRGGSPDELTSQINSTSQGYAYTTTLSYSPNPDDYDPRCVPCHRTHDKEHAAA